MGFPSQKPYWRKFTVHCLAGRLCNERANGLIERYHVIRSVTVGYGAGGPHRALLARAGRLTIGPAAPVIEIDSGTAQADRTAGNIGADLLKPFTITLDYEGRILWLQPNQLAGRPEVFDRSGLWVARAEDGAIEVMDVATESAAAAIGMAVGDEIVSVNGKPAKELTLHDLHEVLKGGAGTLVTLLVQGMKGERNLTLTWLTEFEAGNERQSARRRSTAY